MDRPLVVGTAECGRAVNDELPMTEAEGDVAGQVIVTPASDAPGALRPSGEHTEERDRWAEQVQRSGGVVRVGSLERLNPLL
jgi:hypothetical protein